MLAYRLEGLVSHLHWLHEGTARPSREQAAYLAEAVDLFTAEQSRQGRYPAVSERDRRVLAELIERAL